MDKLLWVAMSGAKENFHSLGVRSNNLANANTVGFKADFENTRSMSVFANAYPTRAFAMTERPGYNMQGGQLETTDRALDIAIAENGLMAIQDAQGNEAYTRFGSLMLDQNGLLQTSSGRPVLDEDGNQIILPLDLEDVAISNDGMISGRAQGAALDAVEEFQRIKLVRADQGQVEKGYDGFFRSRDGNLLAQDPTVEVRSGMVEASNVNPVEELTSLIRIQRQYDMQVKMMETASSMDQAQNSLLAYE